MTRRANIFWLSLAGGALTIGILGASRFFLSPDAKATFILLTWLMWGIIGVAIMLNLWVFVTSQMSQMPPLLIPRVGAIAVNQLPSMKTDPLVMTQPSRVIGLRIYRVGALGLSSHFRDSAPVYDSSRPAICLEWLAHESPDVNCDCGYYAFWGGSRYDIQVLINEAHRDTCLALVSGWGKVVLTQRGWRSQFQRIEAIADYGCSDTNILTRIVTSLAIPMLPLGVLLGDAARYQEEGINDKYRATSQDGNGARTGTVV